MDISLVLRPFILLSLLAVAAVTDLIKHRVSNHVLAIGFIIEAGIHMLSKPVISREPLGLAMLFILVLFILFSMHLIGGADVKLYILCVFTYPNEVSLRIISLSVLVGAVYAVIIMMRQGQAAERYIRLARYVNCLIVSGGRPGVAAAEAAEPETCAAETATGAAEMAIETAKLMNGKAAEAVVSGGYISEAEVSGGAVVPMAAAILAGTVLAFIQGGML